MSFFNFRRATTQPVSPASANAPAQSMEAIRKRAKHRLIGSAALVLAGVVGFPLLFDTQPRPIPIDIAIEIPGKNAVKPLSLPAVPASAPAPSVAAAVVAATPALPAPRAASSAADKVAAASSLSSREEILTEKKALPQVLPAPSAIKKEAKPAPVAEAKPEVKPEVKPETKPAPKPAVAGDDGARARALLNGQASATTNAAVDTATSDERLIVQVGAFADAAKAKEVRMKLERSGLKTYTQAVETADGTRTRVRVGPFGSRADAEKAASKIKALDLPAAILTL
ncbi:MAG: SPOR domain-containing protein [Polaromonas sp.]|nr:MAG: SPOR domain-containing protein [Polaromonas sp.]